MLDILVRGGWVADGTGNPIYPADVAIEGDRVVDVSRLPGAEARRVIDATGKIVCPGFVDCHSHTDSTILVNPTAESTIRQGITTEIFGLDGVSYAPLSRDHYLTYRRYVAGLLGSLRADDPEIPDHVAAWRDAMTAEGHRDRSIGLGWHGRVRGFGAALSTRGLDRSPAAAGLSGRRRQPAAMLGDPLLGLGRGAVIDGDVVAALVLEVPGHRIAHHAEAEKRH